MNAGYSSGFPEVDRTLQALLTGVKAALGGDFVGLYLYGSLATGGFTPGRSDIDFLVVTGKPVSSAQIAGLEATHRRLWASGDPWAAKLEGAYLPIHSLRRPEHSGPSVPSVNEGRFYQAALGIDWVIQRRVLREAEAVVEGPSLREWIDPVSDDELRSAVRALLGAWWEPMLRDPSRLGHAGYPAYAVLSMCRALRLMEGGGVVSKDEAARWALGALPQEWSALIRDASRWRDGSPDGSVEQVRAFIRYAVDRSR